MYRIGVIASDIRRDWASMRLLEAAAELAHGALVDPISFEVRAEKVPSVRIRGEPADTYDAYIVRGFNRQGEIDYQYDVFELLEQLGKVVVNSPAGLFLAESKALTTYFLQKEGFPVPRTLVTQELEVAAAAVREFGTAVVKPLYGSHGIGIERVGSETDGELLPALLDRHGAVYVQEYVPNEGRDIRAFVVGDDIPAAVYRIARDGQWKTNVSQGGICEACELSPVLRELCVEAARLIGLDYTGVDVMEGPDGPMILELNGAPSWYGLSNATDRNIAADVVNHVLRVLDTGQSARQPTGFRYR